MRFTVRSLTGREQGSFLRLPWQLYRGDPNWVPPLLRDMRAIVAGANPLRQAGPMELFLARDGVRVVGRLAVGANETINRSKGTRDGYFTLFECAEDYSVARALLDTGLAWLRERGYVQVKGPVSPTWGDDYRGLLVEGFDSPPVLLNSYNPPYYAEFLERYGFEKAEDLYAYRYDLGPAPERYRRVVDYAMRKFRYRVDRLQLGDLEREIRAIKQVLDEAMPREWPDLTPPRLEELRAMARRLRPLAVPEFIYIARSGAGDPIGFNLALPDYNQVLRHLDGRLFPLGWLKFLWHRRRIDGGRLFVLFVVPSYRKKGVPAAIFLRALEAARRRGYRWAEGSTIGETNLPMRRDAESVGGTHYKTYRIYRKLL
ncbi:MAG: N-acetyltransferase [bacterium]|nr:N-acetyltransferase [bacterium]